MSIHMKRKSKKGRSENFKRRRDKTPRNIRTVYASTAQADEFEKLVNEQGHSFSSAVECLIALVLGDARLQKKLSVMVTEPPYSK